MQATCDTVSTLEALNCSVWAKPTRCKMKVEFTDKGLKCTVKICACRDGEFEFLAILVTGAKESQYYEGVDRYMLRPWLASFPRPFVRQFRHFCMFSSGENT